MVVKMSPEERIKRIKEQVCAVTGKASFTDVAVEKLIDALIKHGRHKEAKSVALAALERRNKKDESPD